MPLVLIVDAYPEARAALADSVRQRGFAAVSVANFEDALAAMYVLDVDVLVSDVQIADAQTRHLPQKLTVLVYTSSTSDSPDPLARTFSKPAHLAHLLAVISASCH